MSAKILLAEDNASNRYLATYLLKNAGFTVLTAHNGRDAIRLALAESPDLVLMDLIMPGMDGVEATRRIMMESPCAILVVTATVEGNSAKVFAALGMP